MADATLFELVTSKLSEAGISYENKSWDEILQLYAALDLPPWIEGDSDWNAFDEQGIGDT